MEFLTIFLSSLLGLVSPAGLIVERTAVNTIRSQFEKVEQLLVRVDNAPSYQLLQGKLERVRIAGRGLHLKQQDIRIAALELETDPIDLEPRSFGRRRPKLRRPLQAGVRLVLTQQDINQALQSPQLTASLRKLGITLLGNQARDAQRYDFVNPRVEFLADNRLRLQVKLQEQGNDNGVLIKVESGLGVVAGHQLQLLDPLVSVDGEAVPETLVNQIATNLSQRLDLRNFERTGITGRILQLKLSPQQLEIAVFVRVKKSFRFR